MKLKLSEGILKSIGEDAINFITQENSSWDPSHYYIVLDINSLENTWDDLLMEAVKEKLVSLRVEIKDIKNILNDDEAEGCEEWVEKQQEIWGEVLVPKLRSMKSKMLKKYNREYNYIDKIFSRDFFIFYNDLQSLIITNCNNKQADFNRLEKLRLSQLDLFCYIRNSLSPYDHTVNPFLPVINNSFCYEVEQLCFGAYFREHYYPFEIEKLQAIFNIKINAKSNDYLPPAYWDESLTEKIFEFFKLTPVHLRDEVAASFLSFFNEKSIFLEDLFVNLKTAQTEIYNILDDLELQQNNIDEEISSFENHHNKYADEDELDSLCSLRDLCVAHEQGAYDETSKLELAESIGFDEEDNGLEFDSLIKGFSNLSDFKKAYPVVGSNFVKIPINCINKPDDIEPLLFITYENDFLFYINLMTDEITQVNR